VQDLLDKGLVQKSLSPCDVMVLLVPKKDGKWRICCDCRAINNITIKYKHPILRLDNMLDELHGANIFSKMGICLKKEEFVFLVVHIENFLFKKCMKGDL